VAEARFTYFSDIEEHFCRRRGTVLMVSTLDWALMESWKDAGIPLEAVLRGIDEAFDKYEARQRSRTQKINGLAWCAQAVMAAAEEMKEAAVGARREAPESGLEAERIAEFLRKNAAVLEKARMPESARHVTGSAVQTLSNLALEVAGERAPRLEDLERHLTVLEEKIIGALLAATPDEQLMAARAEADRELAPYRRKMTAEQIERLHKQFVHKRLLEQYGVPRLSLFYM